MTGRFFLVIGAVLAGLAVALGAFGAHGLKQMVTPERLTVFETAARYQMYHAFALLFVGWMMHQSSLELSGVGYCFLAGITFFCGSLYLLVLTNTPWLGAVTPLGGVAFILGWAWLAWKMWNL